MTTHHTPDPGVVSAIYDLDPDSLRFSLSAGTPLVVNPHDARRCDGSPASPEQIVAVVEARHCDWQAALELHRHARDQLRYELERKERIGELLQKYSSADDDEKLDAIEPRMTPEDHAEYRRCWADLGNVMVLGGGCNR